ncbi:hypothetical protein FC83_GL001032 [Agrilactobacillus composti DSM 18527 = JCM 14202]|uniref:BS ykrK family protein n=1 Tax=Agrilactobacillus composti DSM 18527 = JCM 14202 TaxID=1423734 RepID=X0QLV7_9LACO|nr:DUF1836 domain-containing protein [Agrilactobacillus composti]KRM31031.1 hypothetical protein FC83_GL001032 [Agrilactobacillus composti DSM 18527 = JCM 14202]GAF39595.1 hypothetical protein JCM14202_1462 [Agrilactobacillus composti DSM 18527 = JCM 14202]
MTQQALKLPLWADLPAFDLHLDQLLLLVNEYVAPISGEVVTKTMLHNYFKLKIIVPPVKKRYGRVQLAGAIVVALLKSVFALGEIKQGFDVVAKGHAPQKAYDNFAEIFNRQTSANTQQVAPHISATSKDVVDQLTQVQYAAVQAVLYWLAAKSQLHDLVVPAKAAQDKNDQRPDV